MEKNLEERSLIGYNVKISIRTQHESRSKHVTLKKIWIISLGKQLGIKDTVEIKEVNFVRYSSSCSSR